MVSLLKLNQGFILKLKKLFNKLNHFNFLHQTNHKMSHKIKIKTFLFTKTIKEKFYKKKKVKLFLSFI